MMAVCETWHVIAGVKLWSGSARATLNMQFGVVGDVEVDFFIRVY